MSAEEDFKHESLQDCNSIVAYFQALCACFENKALLLSSDGKRFIMKPQGSIEMEVDAKRKGNRSKLNIRLKWTETEMEGDLQVKPFEIAVVGKL
ncbi:MAG: amphi-Trp domain-containing protein [Pseudomonadota bacterium]